MKPATTSVQFRETQTLLSCYVATGIAPFAIKQKTTTPLFKYEGSDVEEGAQELAGMCSLIMKSHSAAIYTLCLYDNIKEEDLITEDTKAGLGWNFRFFEFEGNAMNGMQPYHGEGLEEIKKELTALHRRLDTIQEEKEGGHMGMIGELMQNEALAPILGALAQKLADYIAGDKKVGELKRVSGVGAAFDEKRASGPAPGLEWANNVQLVDAVSRLNRLTPNLGELLERLADMADKKPKKFALYLAMFKQMG